MRYVSDDLNALQALRGIRKHRETLGLSQEALSEMIGISGSVLSRIEKNPHHCTVLVYNALQRVIPLPDYVPGGKNTPVSPAIRAGVLAPGERRFRYVLQSPGHVYLATYNIGSVDFAGNVLQLRPRNITLLANSHNPRDAGNARRLKVLFPEAEIYIRPDTHVKLLLCEPDYVCIGSMNIGRSPWLECECDWRNINDFRRMRDTFLEWIKEAEQL